MKWKLLIAALSLTGVVGCASIEMTSDARMVRELTLDSGENCKFLGVFDTKITTILGDREKVSRHAKNAVRNEVAAMNGDGFMLSSITEGMTGTTVQYDAYDCGIS